MISELKRAKARYGIWVVWFFDDCFTADRRWVERFCERYKSEIDLPFLCITIPDTLDASTIEMLRDAGCSDLGIGVQSLVKELHKDELKRRFSKRKVASIIEAARDLGVNLRIDHMLGIPGDSLKFQKEAVLFYNRYRPYFLSVYWLTAYPGTEIVEMWLERGLLTKSDVSELEGGFCTDMSTMRPHRVGPRELPSTFCGIATLLAYLPLLPKWLVSFLVRSGAYRLLAARHEIYTIWIPLYMIAHRERIGPEVRDLVRRIPAYLLRRLKM